MQDRKKQWAEQMIALFYADGSKPSPAFLKDMESMIAGEMTENEIVEKIKQRHGV